MAVYEVLTVLLITIGMCAVTVAIYLGLMNWIGAAHVVRCGNCHHLTVAASDEPQQSCPHCRHPILLHPIHAVQHPATARDIELGDRLRY